MKLEGKHEVDLRNKLTTAIASSWDGLLVRGRLSNQIFPSGGRSSEFTRQSRVSGFVQSDLRPERDLRQLMTLEIHSNARPRSKPLLMRNAAGRRVSKMQILRIGKLSAFVPSKST